MEQKDARSAMQGCLYTLIAPAGIMAGLDTVRDCMKDETLRLFLGHALLHEVMPSMGLGRVVLEPGDYAIYFPWDIHVPGQCDAEGPKAYRKIVLKVPVAACL